MKHSYVCYQGVRNKTPALESTGVKNSNFQRFFHFQNRDAENCEVSLIETLSAGVKMEPGNIFFAESCLSPIWSANDLVG